MGSYVEGRIEFERHFNRGEKPVERLLHTQEIRMVTENQKAASTANVLPDGLLGAITGFSLRVDDHERINPFEFIWAVVIG